MQCLGPKGCAITQVRQLTEEWCSHWWAEYGWLPAFRCSDRPFD